MSGNNGKGLTQCEVVLEHLRARGPITQRYASGQYGIDRLGARIWDLKGRGEAIDRELVTVLTRYGGRSTHVALYYLRGRRPENPEAAVRMLFRPEERAPVRSSLSSATVPFCPGCGGAIPAHEVRGNSYRVQVRCEHCDAVWAASVVAGRLVSVSRSGRQQKLFALGEKA